MQGALLSILGKLSCEKKVNVASRIAAIQLVLSGGVVELSPGDKNLRLG